MMIVPAFVFVESFAVVAVDHHNGLVENAMRFQRRENGLDATVHIGKRAVILGERPVGLSDQGNERLPRDLCQGQGLGDKGFHFASSG